MTVRLGIGDILCYHIHCAIGMVTIQWWLVIWEHTAGAARLSSTSDCANRHERTSCRCRAHGETGQLRLSWLSAQTVQMQLTTAWKTLPMHMARGHHCMMLSLSGRVCFELNGFWDQHSAKSLLFTERSSQRWDVLTLYQNFMLATSWLAVCWAELIFKLLLAVVETFFVLCIIYNCWTSSATQRKYRKIMVYVMPVGTRLSVKNAGDKPL